MPDVIDALHQPHMQLLFRLVLGGLLMLAGVSKLAGRDAFRDAVAQYELLPAAAVRPFANVLPAVEIAVGALLLLGLATTAAAALAVPLFLTFAAAIAINIARGRHFDCHCFGAAQRDEIGPASLLRALVLAGGALVVALGTSRFGALEAALFGSSAELPAAAEVVPVLIIAFVVCDILVLLPETLGLRSAFARVRAGHAAAAHAHAPEAAP